MDRRALNSAIMRDYRTVVRTMDRAVLPALIELDLTMAQFKAMIAVDSAGEGGIPVTSLAQELAIGQSAASLLVDQLCQKGRCTRVRDPQDGRRVLVQATGEGRRLVGELREGRRSTFLAWLRQLDDGDAEALARGLAALAGAAADAGE